MELTEIRLGGELVDVIEYEYVQRSGLSEHLLRFSARYQEPLTRTLLGSVGSRRNPRVASESWLPIALCFGGTWFEGMATMRAAHFDPEFRIYDAEFVLVDMKLRADATDPDTAPSPE